MTVVQHAVRQAVRRLRGGTPGVTPAVATPARPDPPPARGSPGRSRVLAACLLVGVAAAVGAGLGLPARATQTLRTTGDEPHYLLTALSLAEDGDLDVTDEVAAGRYRPFHAPALRTQARPRPDGSRVEPHDPLLPAVLAPATALGGWPAARATLLALAGLLGGMLAWTAVRRLAVPPGTAALVLAPLMASAPLATYGIQIYPELPAALAVVAAVAALTGPLRAGGLVALTLSVVALPWLSVKHVPVAAALAAVGLAGLLRGGRHRAAAGLTGLLGLAGLAYLAAHLAWYGGATVYAAGRFFTGHGGQLSVLGTDPDYLGRGRRLVGLLIDADFGVAAWQPAWLLAVPAVAALVRRRPPGWAAVALPAGTGWVVATFLAATMHGWWFPGRHVLAALPLLALALAWWAREGGARLAIVAAAGLAGVVTWAWLAGEAWRGEVGLVVGFADTGAPPFTAWRSLRPDGMDPGTPRRLLDAAWAAVLLGLAWWGWRGAGGGGPAGAPRRE